jgi:heat shock protein HslJ
MRTVLLRLGLLAVTVIVVGCGERTSGVDPAYTAPPDRPLDGRTFLSTTVTEGGKPRALVGGTQVRLQFMADGRLIADAGCNSMQGAVHLDGGRLRLDELGATGVGCDKPRHEQDAWLSRILNATPSWRLDGDTLVITSDGTELVLLDRKVAEPDLPLEGTKWTVDTIVDGQVASSTPAGAAASLRFDNGTVQVAAGCNSGSARYEVSGTTIRFERPAVSRRACPEDVMGLERAVLAVLDGAVEFEISSDQLRLRHSAGKGLHLRGSR